MKVLVIDNYDSFTYNLVQYLGELRAKTEVYRNDKITLAEIEKIAPDRILISPGPGVPKNAGITKKVIKHFAGKIPILGVCLGHQAIGEVFGGKVVRAKVLMHGKTSDIFHDKKTIFKKISSPFTATRYHSLIIEKSSLPKCLEITAKTEDGVIMGVRHKKMAIEGVQFHPESILTTKGMDILKNFLEL
jgi:anthranilate synthase/aminodeoxychorismate synthase-like glutamine amidotransferase